MITGASEGIGRACAQSLAKRGLNVILVSRSQTKLDTLAAAIREQYGVQTRVLAFDFFASDPAAYAPFQKIFNDLTVSVLVNNVGGTGTATYTNDTPATLMETPLPTVVTSANVNILPMVILTSLILPTMAARRKGAIINISSIASVMPFTLSAAYAGAKSFVNHWSLTLVPELRKYNISIEAIVVGGVETSLMPKRANGFDTYRPEQLSEAICNQHGVSAVRAPLWGHALPAWLAGTLPERARLRLGVYVSNELLGYLRRFYPPPPTSPSPTTAAPKTAA